MSNWSSKYIQTNGIQLHYYQTGGDLTPLILAHGITDNGLCWTRLANHLMEDFNVIMIDARGHGHSEAPKSGYSKVDHARDLAGLIEGLELDHPHLIGHSMGAANVSSLASNFPHLVDDGCSTILDSECSFDPLPIKRFLVLFIFLI